MSDTGSSGIHVLEGAPAGAPIAIYRETVAAFIGPAPRGPADIPVAVRSVGEYLRRFGSPDKPSRLERYLAQFFENGGSLAVVVRVCRSQRRNRLRLPAGDASWEFQALCPGAFEYLRASVDYDNISADQPNHFNLVVQRLDSAARPLVVEQEIYRCVSALPQDIDYLGDALLGSSLIQLAGESPGQRPERTVGSGVEADAVYVYSQCARPADDTLSDYDIVGSPVEGTGLHALEQVPRLDMLCIVPPSPEQPLGPVAAFAAERYCRRRDALLLLDPPAHWLTAADAAHDQSWRGMDSPNVITWFPQPENGSLAGAIAGSLVRSDKACGVWHSPSQQSLPVKANARISRVGLIREERVLLARAGVNALLQVTPGRFELQGLVTLGRRAGMSAEWCQLRFRRTALFVAGGIVRGTRWAMFRRGDLAVSADLRQQLELFLGALHAEGAFAGTRPGDSWYLRGPFDLDGNLSFDVGIALRRPGEFLSFRFTHQHGDCTVRELGWQPALALAI